MKTNMSGCPGYAVTDTVGRFRRMAGILGLLLTILLPASVMAAGGSVRTIKSKGTYYAEPDESKAEAQRKAREAAIYEGIREAFGSVMTQTVIQEDTMDDGGEMTRLYSNNAFELKGEWISDVQTTYETRFVDDAFSVTCECEFRARAVTSEAPAIDCAILVAPDRRSTGTRFKDNSNMYVSFSSPSADGYLTICLADEDGMVYKLLPASASDRHSLAIDKGYDYVLFDTNRVAPDGTRMDPVRLSITPGRRTEWNTVYFIFSPTDYADGPWHRGASRRQPAHMPINEFNNWLVTMARRDPSLAYRAIPVTIRAVHSDTETIRYD